MGSKNNLVTVKLSDFEVFQALAKDSEGVHSGAQTEYSQVSMNMNIIATAPLQLMDNTSASFCL